MSQQSQRCVSHLKAVECYIRRTETIRFNGKDLSKKNLNFIKDLYTLLSCLWVSVLPDWELLSNRWTQQLVGADVMTVLEAFKAADSHLMEVGLDPTSFKHWRKLSYPDLGQVFRPIQDMIALPYYENKVKDIRSCLLFITRANFPDPLGLEEEALEKWMDTCLYHKAVSPTPQEKSFVQRLFPKGDDLLRKEFKPRFGPGHNSDIRGTSLISKYQAFHTDGYLNFVGMRVGFKPQEMPRLSPDPLVRQGRLVFVPKQLDRLRSITMEPSSLMFYQQGLFHYMSKAFDKRVSSHIRLDNPQANADLAWEGSISGEYSTIDLSSASDSVSLELVKALFTDTSLCGLLTLTRSTSVSYKGEVMRPTYFAPMGSALCFPVECCVFASVVDAIMRDAGDTRAWRVYGDDIVLPTDYAQKCIERLGELGFSVNKDKSFYRPYPGFRESCGGEYLEGVDVTPFRVSRRFRGIEPRSPSEIEGLISMANSGFAYKYFRLRVISSLKALNPPPLFEGSGELGIFSTHATNFSVRQRYNRNIQCLEYKVGLLKQKSRPSPDEAEDIRLFEYLRSREYSDISDPVEAMPTSIVSPGRPYWSSGWRSPAAGWNPEGLKSPGESRRRSGL